MIVWKEHDDNVEHGGRMWWWHDGLDSKCDHGDIFLSDERRVWIELRMGRVTVQYSTLDVVRVWACCHYGCETTVVVYFSCVCWQQHTTRTGMEADVLITQWTSLVSLDKNSCGLPHYFKLVSPFSIPPLIHSFSLYHLSIILFSCYPYTVIIFVCLSNRLSLICIIM